MKKTLLIAAAALAAGMLSVQAQSNVYSQNIVGYVNTVLPGGGALTVICNPLQGSTNSVTDIMPGLVGGESLYVWTGAGYYVYLFQGLGVGTGLGKPSDWTDPNGGVAGAIPGSTYDADNGVWWTAQPPQLPVGKAAFLQNPNATLTNSFVGTVVLQNSNSPTVLSGGGALSLVSSSLPIGGSLTNSTVSLPFVGGESIYVWNGLGYYVYLYQGAGVGTGLGKPCDYTDPNGGISGSIPGSTYDADNGVWWAPAPPSIQVGSGFFVQNPNSSANWIQNLIVN